MVSSDIIAGSEIITMKVNPSFVAFLYPIKVEFISCAEGLVFKSHNTASVLRKS